MKNRWMQLVGSLVAMATGGLLVTAQAGPVAASWGISAAALQAAEKLRFAVIPSGARNLLLPRTAENKPDSSAWQKAPGFSMTSQGSFSATYLTTATALSPIAKGTSRIFWGWFSDRTGREKAMSIAFLLQGGGLLAVLTLGRMSGTWFTITLVLTFFTWDEFSHCSRRRSAITSAAVEQLAEINRTIRKGKSDAPTDTRTNTNVLEQAEPRPAYVQ